jgi:hypothetical protein
MARLSNPSGAIFRELALPAPDTPHNQIESNTVIEAIDLPLEAISEEATPSIREEGGARTFGSSKI